MNFDVSSEGRLIVVQQCGDLAALPEILKNGRGDFQKLADACVQPIKIRRIAAQDKILFMAPHHQHFDL